ncbi:MAG TPA: DUF5103 domain-containing protein [Chryseosolibacter sp.]|nr:DUF5103 domain-containing protein [Chryseosolibacter sp.]
MKSNLLIVMCFFCGCTPLTQSTQNLGTNPKTLRLIDLAYEPQIRTAVIRPAIDDPQTFLEPAVTRLGDWKLMLEFDDLRDQRDTYYARIIHCNHDWTRSSLMDLDFLNEFNEFPIINFEFSVDTHIPYVHYWLNLPPVKLPGNYMVVVYRGSDKNDIILSKRFMVFDTRVSFENERNLIGAGNIASLNQQINFTINYKNLDVINPLQNIKVSIRQNRRWDNVATDIKPSFVREIEKQLEYRFFEPEKMFKGGNEFRFFDLRSLNNPGRNVARVNRTVKPYEVFIEPDKSRADEVYSQLNDLNGGFIPDNLDEGGLPFTNYAFVNFLLHVPRPFPGNVFVTGAFNYWNLNDENRMQYDSAAQDYKARILLKQGWYDYQYLVQSPGVAPHLLEGSHFETENFYEILVYYRPFQPQADLLIGYMRLEKNPR